MMTLSFVPCVEKEQSEKIEKQEKSLQRNFLIELN